MLYSLSPAAGLSPQPAAVFNKQLFTVMNIKTNILILFIAAVFAVNASAGTGISLLLQASGKTVAQLTPDMNGSVTFANLPDGKYKAEITINMKRFVLDSDIDSDGMADMEITTQQDAATGSKSIKMPKTYRILLTDKGKRKPISMSEWTQALTKQATADGTQTVMALEIKVEGNNIKVRALYSPVLEELKAGL